MAILLVAEVCNPYFTLVFSLREHVKGKKYSACVNHLLSKEILLEVFQSEILYKIFEALCYYFSVQTVWSIDEKKLNRI